MLWLHALVVCSFRHPAGKTTEKTNTHIKRLMNAMWMTSVKQMKSKQCRNTLLHRKCAFSSLEMVTFIDILNWSRQKLYIGKNKIMAKTNENRIIFFIFDFGILSSNTTETDFDLLFNRLLFALIQDTESLSLDCGAHTHAHTLIDLTRNWSAFVPREQWI